MSKITIRRITSNMPAPSPAVTCAKRRQLLASYILVLILESDMNVRSKSIVVNFHMFDAKALQEFHRTHALVCAEHYQWTDEQSVLSLHCAQLLAFSWIFDHTSQW